MCSKAAGQMVTIYIVEESPSLEIQKVKQHHHTIILDIRDNHFEFRIARRPRSGDGE